MADRQRAHRVWSGVDHCGLERVAVQVTGGHRAEQRHAQRLAEREPWDSQRKASRQVQGTEFMELGTTSRRGSGSLSAKGERRQPGQARGAHVTGRTS
jgi:hypothetical protein